MQNFYGAGGGHKALGGWTRRRKVNWGILTMAPFRSKLMADFPSRP